MKTQKFAWTLAALVLAFGLGSGTARAGLECVNVALSFSPSNTVSAGTQVDVIATETSQGLQKQGNNCIAYGSDFSNHTRGSGAAVVNDSVMIQQLQLANGTPVACGTENADWERIDNFQGSGELTNASGQVTFQFDTTDLGGLTIGFRAHSGGAPTAELPLGSQGAHQPEQTDSACANLTITADNVRFYTFTQGGYGNNCPGPHPTDNPACLLDDNFTYITNNNPLVVGNSSCGYTITYSGSAAVHNALPGGGTAAPLTGSLIDPVKADMNVFWGQVTTLKINVLFSSATVPPSPFLAGLANYVLPANFCTQSLSNPADIQAFTVPSGLAGQTVGAILTSAQNTLSNSTCTAGNISDLNAAVSVINEAFDNGREVVACAP
ncbi:MAG: hypothetical protein A3H27_14230 [Acidobacteria bacterium RIFCSPLOWO2_02_FULL_59_13]|nr:MAG: hypothetical protein A3H27_14230 [Acidobacteria bacterium RIFCSPLOWO2_02_FULL_59_13]